jgi:hypothetical protein
MLHPERVKDTESSVVLDFREEATHAQLVEVADWMTARLPGCFADANVGSRRVVASKDRNNGFQASEAAKFVRENLPPRYWATGFLGDKVHRHDGVNFGIVYSLMAEPDDSYCNPQLEESHRPQFAAQEGIGLVRFQQVGKTQRQLRFTLLAGHGLSTIRRAAANIGLKVSVEQVVVSDPDADYDLFEHFRNRPGSIFLAVPHD